jgi:thiamine pyrophosphate-dependent acetolactate synthase large subunit-like protein
MGIAITDVRHEAAAGHAAEGYARAGRRIGVAMLAFGLGTLPAMPGISLIGALPLAALSGHQPHAHHPMIIP